MSWVSLFVLIFPVISVASFTVSNRAVCVIKGDISGTIWFHQATEYGPTKITGQLSGLTPGKHGFHVHQWGDTTNGCISAGPHFNPFRQTHHGPHDDHRHVGDLGNLVAGANYSAFIYMTDNHIQLHGATSIIGRAVVVHSLEDDMGRGTGEEAYESSRTGNAGARIGCGVIGWAPPLNNVLHV